MNNLKYYNKNMTYDPKVNICFQNISAIND